MERFHIIEDAEVVTVTRSVYRQSKVYQRAGGLYMGQGSGFVRLYAGGGTGLPNTRWDDIEIPGVASAAALKPDPHGKLSLPDAFKQIEGAAK